MFNDNNILFKTEPSVEQSRINKLRSISREIVRISKEEAHEDTGRLKRSISYVIDLQGNFVFTEVFYGQFNENSRLAENVKRMFPQDEPYKIVWTDDNWQPYQIVRRTSGGRTAVNTDLNTKAKRSLDDTLKRYRQAAGKIGGIRDFIKKIANGTQDKTAN